MDWIETTGRTLEEAKEAALDELGVDETDAEFEVVAEAKSGLFGRVRQEARVRARVRPTSPRPKDDRRDRRRRRGTEAGGATPAVRAEVATATTTEEAPAVVGTAADATVATAPEGVQVDGDETAPSRRSRSPRRPAADATTPTNDEEPTMSDAAVSLDQQAEEARTFVTGLLDAFGLEANVDVRTNPTEEVVDVAVTGENLGLLIGPKGATLLALQDLARAAVQQSTGSGSGRLHIDVSGYRQKRSEALARFALQVAEQVKVSGVRQPLEPMSAPDRKVIHDTLTDVEGVTTISEGEDAARRVVIQPA